MSNILSFLENNQNKSFDELEIQIVDFIILSQLTYLNFERYEKTRDAFVYIKEFAFEKDNLTEGNLYVKKNGTLLEKIINSKRYENLMVGEVETSLKQAVQYAAISFYLDNKYIIGFRGTDMSIAGWKEDLNLLVEDEIPSYTIGINYTNKFIEKYNTDIYLIGHSKGGNIAVYIASNVLNIQNKIIKVYNFDGPGFKNDIFTSEGYINIENKIEKYIPQNDIVGVLLNHANDYSIIKSKSIGILQHDLFTWEVKDDNLIVLDNETRSSKLFDKTIYSWIDSMSFDEKKKLIFIIFKIFDDAKLNDFNELKHNTFKVMKNLIVSYVEIPNSDKKMLFKLIKSLIKFYINNIFSTKEEKNDI